MIKPVVYLSLTPLATAHAGAAVDYATAHVFLQHFVVPNPDDEKAASFKAMTRTVCVAQDMPGLVRDPKVDFLQILTMFWMCQGIAKAIMIRLQELLREGRYAYGTTNAGLRIFLAQNDLPIPKWLPVDGPLDPEWIADVADACPDFLDYDIRA